MKKRAGGLLPILLSASLVFMSVTACALGSSPTATSAPPPDTAIPPTEAVLTNSVAQPTAALPPTEAPPAEAAGAAPTAPLVSFADQDEKPNSAVVFDLTNFAAPASGILIGWLTDDAGTPFKMGTVQAATQTQFVDSEGRDLFGLFSGALVTVEESDSATEPGVIALKGALPTSLLPTLRQIAVTAATPKGLAFDPGMYDQAHVLETHGGLLDEAAKANDYKGMRLHAEHVVNITVGQNNSQYGDLDGDGETQNPGDGFGVAEYANGLITLLDQIQESAESSDWRNGVASEIRQCAVNVRNYATDSVGLAQTVLQAADPASALVSTDQISQYTKAAYEGFDQNGNGQIEYVPQECGATQAYSLYQSLTAIELQPAGG